MRISERSGQLCRELVSLFTQFLKQTKSLIYLPSLVSIVEYSATNIQATTIFSQWCNLRVIWGGDQAIAAISQIVPETEQLCFPDRYSIAVCHLQKSDDIERIVRQFIADLLPFNQQACSSPKALFWLNTAESLQEKFSEELQTQLTAHQQQFTLSEQVERQINIQQILMKKKNKVLRQFCYKQLATYQLETISAELLALHQGNGLLLVKNIDLVAHLPFSKKLQTVSCFGLHISDISTIEQQQHKRITAFGEALQFNHVWDGVNLLNKL